LKITVVLVEPIYGGNVGSVARIMANFGIADLAIVGQFEPDDDDALRMSMHGRHLLEKAVTYDSIKDVPVDIRVGTTGRFTSSEKGESRFAHSPEELVELLKDFDGNVGLLFGREDAGLSNEEIAICDIVASIPAEPDYPILNLSHAVGIFLYEFSRGNWELPEKEEASAAERDLLVARARELLEMLEYDDARRERVETYFRRIFGRAVITKWEYHALMGFFGDLMDGHE
jgi:TrmH family RNA methyltransferase